MISTRASGWFSRSHFASQTMVSDLPEPWVCQMMPPSRAATRNCAASTPKYWLGRHILRTPWSKTVKSWTSSSSRRLSSICDGRAVERIVEPCALRLDLIADSARNVLGQLPLQPVLLRREDRRVAQALGVVAGQRQLHGREERADEVGLLVTEGLADAVLHERRRALQLVRDERDAIDVDDDIRALRVLPGNRDLLNDGEVVVVRVLPVNQPHRVRNVAQLRA